MTINLTYVIIKALIENFPNLLAGKTGTAELKESTVDTSGMEIGWFAVFTADKNVKTPILMISMVENVKGIGGSGYVVSKDKAVLDQYFAV